MIQKNKYIIIDKIIIIELVKRLPKSQITECMYIPSQNEASFACQSFQLPQYFYDQVSNIIKIFRKQLTLFIKLSQSFIEESELVGEMIRKKDEGLEDVKEYQSIVVDEGLYNIIQRFLARIKQILQLTNNIAPGFLQYVSNGVKKVQIFIHKSIGIISVYQIFTDILNILPSYFTAKSFSPQKAKLRTKQNKQNIPLQKRSTALDLILEGFKKSCSLLSTLDIDESQYRALFFSAREDRHRETTYLENEMKYRNRFIREEMMMFDSGYESHREKLRREKENLNKKQLSKLKRMKSLNEKASPTKKVQNQQNKEHNTSLNLAAIKEQKKSYSPDFLLMQSKAQKSNLLTTFNFNQAQIKQTTMHSNMYSYKDKSLNKERFTKMHQRVANEKAREEEFQDFINEIKVKGEFRMTKVLFGRDGKLELSPYTDVKPSSNSIENPTAAAIKNKIIFRKAQENIRKKLNRLTTEPPPFNSSNPNNNKSASIPENSPPATQKKVYISSQPTEALKIAINKKMRKFTWKDKEIKFMGVKGMNSIKINPGIKNF